MCVCLSHLYPNDATPISLLPCWVTVGSWLYERIIDLEKNIKKNKSKKNNSERIREIIALLFCITLLFALVACAATSFGIGLSYTFNPNNTLDVQDNIESNLPETGSVKDSGAPFFEARGDAIFPFELDIDYRLFQKAVLIIYGIFSLVEIIFVICSKIFKGKGHGVKQSTLSPNNQVNKLG